MPHVTWMNGLRKTLPRLVRQSWEAHVFWPGEQVMLDEQSHCVPADAAAQILARSDTVTDRLLTIRETFIDAAEPGAGKLGVGRSWPEFRASYSLVGCAGLWPHAWFIDPHPMRHVYGALVGHGEETGADTADAGRFVEEDGLEGGRAYLMPLLAGSTHQRDPGQPSIQLEPFLGRRAKLALKEARLAHLPPMLGEFLVALTSETSGILYAVLWHSALDAVDMTTIRPMLPALRLGPQPLP